MRERRVVNFLYSLPIILLIVAQANSQEPFDRYPSFEKWSHERASLDSFAIYLQQHPEMVGYIMFYRGEDGSLTSVRKRISRARGYLIRVRGIEPRRLKIIDRGRLGRTAFTILQPLKT